MTGKRAANTPKPTKILNACNNSRRIQGCQHQIAGSRLKDLITQSHQSYNNPNQWHLPAQEQAKERSGTEQKWCQSIPSCELNKYNVSLVLDLSWEGSRKHPQRLVVCQSFVEAVTGSGSGYLGLSGAESRAVISRLEVCPGLLEN